MPKRASKKERKKNRQPEEDINQLAYRLVKESTSEPDPMTKAQISHLMAAMGRKGGKIGGKRRMVTMTAEERSQIALKAAKTRWAKKNAH